MLRIHTIDCHYHRPQFAASYLLEDGKRACFIENNTSLAVPYLPEALRKHSLSLECVELIMVTHAHLDHAGGTAKLLDSCPNATVLAHPKAAKTLIDPSKLLASAKKVYGEKAFVDLYGEILPVPQVRVRSIQDNEEIKWGSADFRFLHTLGHASHHFCVHEKTSNSIFTGDAFGIRYPQVSEDFIFPSTSPIDFDPLEAKKSVRRIVDTGAEKAYLTHYDFISDLKKAAKELLIHLDFHEEVLNKAIRSPLTGKDLSQFCEDLIQKYFHQEVGKRKIIDSPETWEILQLDISINAQGIAFVAERARQKA